MNDLREWLLDRIDGGEEMRGEDGLVSNFIRQIDAQDAELADLKQRLLPQYLGRAERAENAKRMAEHERDAMLEELIVRRTAIANLHNVIDGMRDAPSATAATENPEYEYAKALATLLHKRYYSSVEQWRPLDSTMGILTQIDNMISGAFFPQSVPVEVAAIREAALDEVMAALEAVLGVKTPPGYTWEDARAVLAKHSHMKGDKP